MRVQNCRAVLSRLRPSNPLPRQLDFSRVSLAVVPRKPGRSVSPSVRTHKPSRPADEHKRASRVSRAPIAPPPPNAAARAKSLAWRLGGGLKIKILSEC